MNTVNTEGISLTIGLLTPVAMIDTLQGQILFNHVISSTEKAILDKIAYALVCNIGLQSCLEELGEEFYQFYQKGDK